MNYFVNGNILRFFFILFVTFFQTQKDIGTPVKPSLQEMLNSVSNKIKLPTTESGPESKVTFSSLPTKSDLNSREGSVDNTPSKLKRPKSVPRKPENSSKRSDSNASSAKKPKLSSARIDFESSPFDNEEKQVFTFLVYLTRF